MEKKINGHKLSFKNWEGKRVYVRVPSKLQGHQQVGYLDIVSGNFIEDKGKGMVQWLQYQVGISLSELKGMCQEEITPKNSGDMNYIPHYDASGME